MGQKLTLAISVLALLLAVAPRDTWKAERHYPPLVFSSHAVLECSVSVNAAGSQKMRTVDGQGLSFEATLLPLQRSSLQLTSPGMKYKFDAYPDKPVAARLGGIGEGTITEMKAEVEVAVARYTQLGGPGTAITFSNADIGDGAYVEYTGVFVRKSDSKRFPFRVLFGSVTTGNGRVLPASKENTTSIMSKMVNLGTTSSPASVTTALYEQEDDVRRLVR